jgi:hypothetical protein
MGAIVGVTAWSRGQEKLGGVVSGNSTTDILSSRSPTFGIPSTRSTSASPGATTASGKLIVPQEPQTLI